MYTYVYVFVIVFIFLFWDCVLWCHQPISIVMTFSCGSEVISHMAFTLADGFLQVLQTTLEPGGEVPVDSQWFTVTANGSKNSRSCSLRNILFQSRKRDRHNPNVSIKALLPTTAGWKISWNGGANAGFRREVLSHHYVPK